MTADPTRHENKSFDGSFLVTFNTAMRCAFPTHGEPTANRHTNDIKRHETTVVDKMSGLPLRTDQLHTVLCHCVANRIACHPERSGSDLRDLEGSSGPAESRSLMSLGSLQNDRVPFQRVRREALDCQRTSLGDVTSPGTPVATVPAHLRNPCAPERRPARWWAANRDFRGKGRPRIPEKSLRFSARRRVDSRICDVTTDSIPLRPLSHVPMGETILRVSLPSGSHDHRLRRHRIGTAHSNHHAPCDTHEQNGPIVASLLS